MKNNKGYYSWIHSMKNAALESHFKGREMINEAKKRTDDNSDSEDRYDPKIAAELAKLRQERAGQFTSELERSRRAEEAQKAEAMRPLSLDVEGAEELPDVGIQAHRRAMRKDLGVEDLNGDGVKDANDVVADGQDGVMGNQRIPAGLPKAQWAAARGIQGTKGLGEIPGTHQALRDLTLALDMRSKGEHGELSKYHKQLLKIHDQAARDASISRERNVRADAAAEHADEMLGAGHGPLGLRFESVNQKISRLLNG